MPPASDMINYGDYPPVYFDPPVPGYPINYNEYMPANQPLASYQGTDNSGFEANDPYENSPTGLLSDPCIEKQKSLDWNPISLAKLYPKLYLCPSGTTYTNGPHKNKEAQLSKNADKFVARKLEDFINSDSFPLENGIENKSPPQVSNEMWKSLFKQMASAKHNESDTKNIFLDLDNPTLNPRKLIPNNMDVKFPEDNEALKLAQSVPNLQKNISVLNIPGLNGETERVPLPEKLVKKKTAQMKALQNLSKLKAMIHIAKEDRRAVQHKREEARRQFLSEVAEELQLMSSAKLAEIEASKSYRALSAAERALADKDRDIHMLLEKEDTLYEDLTDAEASLAKADMTFIPKIKSEDELRQFASFLNFGF